MGKANQRFIPKKSFMDLLNEKQISAYGLAKKCEVAPTTIYQISQGKTEFVNSSVGLAIEISDALDMTVEEIVKYLYKIE
ncbi:helix-turn-helix domain-containing protein [Anaerofustis stercorihominis]|uniref:helix-turn-helix domain-containing protein n=1 Tax=Anaerofustis stercorihominis TaxID=214853 RepID=UPI0026716F69|nr:helix-turn-helix transcriptional regulator [Anaerofustis stercorihominis]